MNPEFAARFPLEMLHCIGYIDCLAVDARVFKALIQQPSRGSDKGVALFVFAVAGLFADHHHPNVERIAIGLSRSHLSEYGLSRVLIEIAPMAMLDGMTQYRK